MKAFKLLMMAGLMAFAASAQAQNKIFSADDVIFDESGKANLEVYMDFSGTETIVGWNMSIYLPEGVTLGTKLVENEDTGEMEETWDYTAKGNDYSNSAKMANNMDIKEKTDGGYLFTCIASDKTPMKNTKGKILTVALVASTSDCSGDGSIKTIGMSDDKNVSVLLNQIDEVTFKVDASATVGINEIQTAGSEAPAYNLQGIRVNNAKGLIIRDGKKMIVK